MMKKKIRKRVKSTPSLVVFEIYLTNLLNQYGDIKSLLFGNFKNIVQMEELKYEYNSISQLKLITLVDKFRDREDIVKFYEDLRNQKQFIYDLKKAHPDDIDDLIIQHEPTYFDNNIRQWYSLGESWKEIHPVQADLLFMIDDMLSPQNHIKTDQLNTLFLKKTPVSIERIILDEYTWQINIDREFF